MKKRRNKKRPTRGCSVALCVYAAGRRRVRGFVAPGCCCAELRVRVEGGGTRICQGDPTWDAGGGCRGAAGFVEPLAVPVAEWGPGLLPIAGPVASQTRSGAAATAAATTTATATATATVAAAAAVWASAASAAGLGAAAAATQRPSTVHVGANSSRCSDSGPGTVASPVCTIPRAVAMCRGLRRAAKIGGGGGGEAGARCTVVVLGGGMHRVSRTVELTGADSGLAIVAGVPGAVVSGASLLALPGDPGWRAVRAVGSPAEALTLWRLPAPAGTYGKAPKVDTLYVDGVRAIQSRWPNADPEVDKFPVGYITRSSLGAQQWVPPRQLPPNATTYIAYPGINRTDFKDIFTDYRGGVGGHCRHFTAPFSYWCAATSRTPTRGTTTCRQGCGSSRRTSRTRRTAPCTAPWLQRGGPSTGQTGGLKSPTRGRAEGSRVPPRSTFPGAVSRARGGRALGRSGSSRIAPRSSMPPGSFGTTRQTRRCCKWHGTTRRRRGRCLSTHA